VDARYNRDPLEHPQFCSIEAVHHGLLRTGHVSGCAPRMFRRHRGSRSVHAKDSAGTVLGVMLTENDELKSSARSSVAPLG
jgi:hypothetical protein